MPITSDDLKLIIQTAKEAAMAPAVILREGFRNLESGQVRLKGMGDYVTDWDHRAEAVVIDKIRSVFPNHGICAEESGMGKTLSDWIWYIDPLDGTTNFVQGIPVYSVSVAAVHAGVIQAGAVFIPEREELFWAVCGGGAFLGDKPISVSGKNTLEHSVLATGFPWRSRAYLEAYLAAFSELFTASAGVRRLGSAAIDLAFTACGRFDGFWEMKLKPWDICAGILLLREAGGTVSDFRGEQDWMRSGNVLAANQGIYPLMLDVSLRHLTGIE
jgi:myo-inositol-1(or 4)-monophosphatase